MISLVFIILFIFSLAIGVTCVLVSYQLVNSYQASFLKYYFYYLISFYAFAIYAIWGQIIVRMLLTHSGIEYGIIERTASFLPMLGVPFLIVSWIMLINMAHGIFELQVHKWWRLFHILLFVLILLGVWVGYEYFSESNQVLNTPLKYITITFFTILSSLNYLTFLILIIYYMRKIELRGDRFILSFVGMLLAAFIVRWLVTFFAFSDSWVLGIVILIFFTTNLLPLLYLKFKADDIFDLIKADKTDEDRFEKIFKKYKISNREKEIIKQICSGKTNQQIADELFISLQTVKDHTHRIYTKIGINSRMKLVQVVNV